MKTLLANGSSDGIRCISAGMIAPARSTRLSVQSARSIDSTGPTLLGARRARAEICIRCSSPSKKKKNEKTTRKREVRRENKIQKGGVGVQHEDFPGGHPS
ncbi:hypothetical protein MIMGU_mgv11b015002mg [Erythranthe guttata]|uniref:Uncharacterized protein n=1 Tax=Erythranthe guttata TaxID=4155 RepID=A0A022QP83_ERYGU|nr:hypothetical protein MIMGU_mgv11b015002mg [Erythranthe guttata]